MQPNPYSPPGSELGPAPPVKDIAAVTYTLGVLSILPVFLLLALPSMWEEILDDFSADPLLVGAGLCTAVVSIAAGGLLLALRPAVVPAYALAFLLVVAKGVAAGEPIRTVAIGAVLYAVGLAYSLWLRSCGVLRSRPNNSSKPTPLRGAA